MRWRSVIQRFRCDDYKKWSYILFSRPKVLVRITPVTYIRFFLLLGGMMERPDIILDFSFYGRKILFLLYFKNKNQQAIYKKNLNIYSIQCT